MKSPFQEFVESLRKAVTDSASAVNGAVKNLPLTEQFEAQPEVAIGLRALKNFGAEFIDQLQRLDGRFTPEVIANAEKAFTDFIKESAVKAGELVKKTDLEAQVNAAREGARKEATDEVTGRFQKQADAAAKRAELLKEIPTVVASRVPDEVLLAPDAVSSVEKFKERLKKFSAVGVTAENSAGFLAEIAALPLTKEGDDQFATRLAPIEASFNAAKGGKASTSAASNPLLPPSKEGDDTAAPADDFGLGENTRFL